MSVENLVPKGGGKLPPELLIRRLRDLGRPLNHVISVGTNIGSELDLLVSSGPLSTVVCFEPLPSACIALRAKYGAHIWFHLVEAAASDRDDKATSLYVSSNENGMSSTVVGPATHNTSYSLGAPEQVWMVRVDTAIKRLRLVPEPQSWDLVIIDAQGHDLHVLAGLGRLVMEHRIGGILVEAPAKPEYPGGCTREEIDGAMKVLGYRMVVRGFDNTYYESPDRP